MSIQIFTDSHTRWRAITTRDPAAHFAFLYGVTSTKIYCRPTCAARCARRANVVFYDTVEQARADGFRACQRCKPDDTLFMGDREETAGQTLALLRTSNGNLAMRKSIKQLAAEVGVTPSYLCRVFKQTMGMTIGQYVDDFEGPNAICMTGGGSSARKLVDTHENSPSSACIEEPCVIWETAPQPKHDAMTSTDACDSTSSSSTPSWLQPGEVSSCPDGQGGDEHGGCTMKTMEFDLDDWLWTESFDLDLPQHGVQE